MFGKSASPRRDFYDDMLFEVKIALRPEGIAFGAVAKAFVEMVIICIHLGHLIFFY